MSSLLRFLKEFSLFCMKERKWWLFPIVITLLIISVLFVIGQNTSIAPFIYAIF